MDVVLCDAAPWWSKAELHHIYFILFYFNLICFALVITRARYWKRYVHFISVLPLAKAHGEINLLINLSIRLMSQLVYYTNKKKIQINTN